jgi:S-adenosylmethionine:tRNA ribosyltransferase-isomerase
MTDFDLKSYHFDLPEELIALRPVADRHSSRLLVYDEAPGVVTHSTFAEINRFLPQHSTMVFNRSKVFPCRLIGKKMSGGAAEVFILSLSSQNDTYPALIRTTGKKKIGDEYQFENLKVKVETLEADGTFRVSFNISESELPAVLNQIGKIPIPPYIRNGESDEADKKNYQTVFAQESGSVAAPTAGLHFSEKLLKELEESGQTLATVTLHVGVGTFAKIKVDNILEHKMHEEFYTIDPENLKKIQNASYSVAVGTTTLRTLESSWNGVTISPSQNSTSIFLHPGKPVHSIDALVTNFHLPESSLLILVSALIGRKKTLELYELAIKERYRFFSYGDGMLILRNKSKGP